MNLRNLPLRWMLPSAVFFSIILIALFSVLYTLNSERTSLLEAQRGKALGSLTELSRLAEQQLDSNRQLIERELLHRAAERHVEGVWLISPEQQIIFSHRREDTGRPALAQLSVETHNWLLNHIAPEDRSPVRSPHVDIPEGENKMFALAPFRIGGSAQVELGYVFSKHDLTMPMQTLTYEHLIRRLPDMIGAFLLALLLTYWIRRQVTQPLDQLAVVSDRVAKGDFSQWVPERGNGELYQLTRRFNRMIQQLAESRDQQRLAAVAFETAEAAMVCSPNGKIEQINQAFTQTTGYTPEDAIGKRPSLLKSGWHKPQFYRDLWTELLSKGRWQGKIINRHRDGHTYPQWTAIRTVYDQNGEISHFVTSFFDLTEQEQARRALEQSERRFRSIFDHAPIAYQSLDAEGRFIDVNQTLCKLLDRDRRELIGRSFFDFWSDHCRAIGHNSFQRFINSGTAHNQLELIKRDGSLVTVVLEGRVQHDDRGAFSRTHCVLFDITARAEMERNLARREEQLRNLIDAMPDLIILFDHHGRWLETNRFNLNLFGIDPNQYSNKSSKEIAHDNPTFANDLTQIEHHNEAAWQAGQTLRQEEYLTDRYGAERVFDVIRVPQYRANGQRKGLVLIGRDVTEQRAAQKRAEHLAFYDPLTNLPNRLSLHQALQDALDQASHREHFGALLQLDIDHFKTINDARGHTTGDDLLKKVAARLNTRLPSGAVLAHTGGDEFALALPDLGRHAQKAADKAYGIAENINDAFAAPFIIHRETFYLSAGIGIALFPERPGTTPGDVLREADTAMYQAKHAGRSHIRFYQHEMGHRVEQRLKIEGLLRQALARQDLSLHIQCQVNDHGKTASGEVLLRWHDTERGMISPAEFIPVAEESGLIIPIGEWVIKETCQLLSRMRREGRPLKLSVNVSPRQFKHPDFADTVENIILKTGVEPGDLTFEITEGLIIDHVEETIEKMRRLAEIGIRFSLDDFGTGYSSLSYLKRLPIDELKIDKSFVIDAPTDPNDAALVEAILAVCSHLDLKVVAEGVETAEHAAFLRHRAQMLYQGFYYCKPIPAEDFLQRWIEQIEAS